MFEIFIFLFFVGTVITIMAWYRGRHYPKKEFTWLSYTSLGAPVFLLAALFMMPHLTQHLLLSILTYTICIGSPLALIVSIIALFKKGERNIIAIPGLFLSLILVGVIVIFILLIISYSP